MTAPTRLSGVLAPVVTPFKRDLSSDRERYVRHCKWLLANGCRGLAVFGTNSEANSLSIDERMVLLETLVQEGVPADRLMPGTGCCALTDSVRLTAHAAADRTAAQELSQDGRGREGLLGRLEQHQGDAGRLRKIGLRRLRRQR